MNNDDRDSQPKSIFWVLPKSAILALGIVFSVILIAIIELMF